MCVNKRREPTTASQVTRRAIRKAKFRTRARRWGVVRALGEIASLPPPTTAEARATRFVDELARIYRPLGIFGASCSSYSLGMGAESAT
jgi:hypothetical protein